MSELEALLRQGKLEEAVALGTELVEEYPDSFLIRLQLARALKENNGLLRAESVLSALDSRYGDNITFLMERGDLLRRLGRLDEAEQDYEKILFLDPFNSKVKRALEEIQADRKQGNSVAFEVVDYSSDEFRDDQTVPELIMKTEPEAEFVSYEPVLDLDAEPENEQFFNPVSYDPPDDREPSFSELAGAEEWHAPYVDEPAETVSDKRSDDDWIQVDIAPPPETAAALDSLSVGHESGFVTESAARLYAQQGLYREALSIYERLGQMSSADKYRDQRKIIKGKIAAERQLDYFKKMLTHFTGDRGSYFV